VHFKNCVLLITLFQGRKGVKKLTAHTYTTSTDSGRHHLLPNIKMAVNNRKWW